MPLRDHFRPPTIKMASWEGFHGQWPAVIVQQLKKLLPAGYVAGPRVHFGSQAAVAVVVDETAEPLDTGWVPPPPNVSVEIDLDFDEYEVRIYNATRERTLVATIEIVSPANKDRAEARNAFIGKCAALLRKGIAVSIVDLVTVRHANLYAELLALLGLPERTFGAEPPAVYAASCRWVREKNRAVLQTWPRALAVGQPLPVLPLWLTPARALSLDLEASYEKACDDLSIV